MKQLWEKFTVLPAGTHNLT